jgi:uncharacterized membrane protein YfcA
MAVMIPFPDVASIAFAQAAGAALAGGVLMGFTGFGSTLTMVPLITLVWGPTEAVAIAIFISIVGTAQLYPGAIRIADWPDLWPAAVGALIGAPLGAIMLLTGDPEVTRRIMGGAVIAVAAIMMRGWLYRGPRNSGVSGGFGLFGGFISGYFGIGAPAVTMYYLSAERTAAVQRANIVLVLLAFSVVTISSLAIGGGVGARTLTRAVALLPVYMGGIWVGDRLFRIASDAIYRRVALWLLVAMGITVMTL